MRCPLALALALALVLAGCSRVDESDRSANNASATPPPTPARTDPSELCLGGERALRHPFTGAELASVLRHEGPAVADELRASMAERVARQLLVAGNETYDAWEGAIRVTGANVHAITHENVTHWSIDVNATWGDRVETFSSSASVINDSRIDDELLWEGPRRVPMRWSEEAEAVARADRRVTQLDPGNQSLVDAVWASEAPGCVRVSFGSPGAIVEYPPNMHGHIPPRPVIELWYDLTQRAIVHAREPWAG